MEQKHFGEHLTLDGYMGDPLQLNNKELITKLLSELPSNLGMHALTDPLVVLAPEVGLKDPGGWSGFVIIAESHISLHTFPKRRFISADIYTCQNGLDVEYIKQHFIEKFTLGGIETNFIIRGTKYPATNLE